MSIKLIAFDIDGTLLPRGVGTIDAYTKKALELLNDKGIKTVICTGRLITFMQEDVINTIKSDYFININGATIADGNFNIIKEYPISIDSFYKVLDEALKIDVAIGFKYPKEMAVYNRYDYFMSIYTKGNKLPDLIYNYEKAHDFHLSHGMPMGAFLIGDNDKLGLLFDRVPELEFVRAYDKGAECFRKDVSKANSLKWVADKLNISMDEVMAFGDSGNDIPMLKASRISVAMGNGTEEVKKIATYITDADNNYGIPKALRHYKLIDIDLPDDHL